MANRTNIIKRDALYIRNVSDLKRIVQNRRETVELQILSYKNKVEHIGKIWEVTSASSTGFYILPKVDIEKIPYCQYNQGRGVFLEFAPADSWSFSGYPESVCSKSTYFEGFENETLIKFRIFRKQTDVEENAKPTDCCDCFRKINKIDLLTDSISELGENVSTETIIACFLTYLGYTKESTR